VKRNKKLNRHALIKSALYRIRRCKDLCRILQISPTDLPLLSGQTLYLTRDIVTEKGKARHTETPIRRLRRVHERLAGLLMAIEPPDFLFFPAKGRSQIDNAARHRFGKVICTLDIKDYFPSAPPSKVAWFFGNTMKCAPDVSAILAKLTTKDGHIPTGSPLSSILAFYAYFDMWSEIATIASRNAYVISLYGDDLTISGEDVRGEIVWNMKQAIHRAGLRYHKEHVYRGMPAMVTGIVIDGGALMIPHRQHRKIHDVRLAMRAPDGAVSASQRRRLDGLTAYRKQVRIADSSATSATNSRENI
jgi:hypothetical protein